MGYLVDWAWKKTTDPFEEFRNHPCFAQMAPVGDLNHVAISLLVRGEQGKKHGDPEWEEPQDMVSTPPWQDMSDSLLYTSRLKRYIKYWLHIGKLCGFKFDVDAWSFDKESGQLVFCLDLTFLKKGKFKGLAQARKRKIIHAHAFFLRLLVERSATIWCLIYNRTKLHKKFPNLPLVALVALCERYCNEVKGKLPLFDWRGEYNKQKKYPEKMKKMHALARGTHAYNGHHFFQYMTKSRIEIMKLFPNILNYMVEFPVTNFDTELWSDPRDQGNIYAAKSQRNLFEEAEVCNGK